jgi:hypothetical protein
MAAGLALVLENWHGSTPFLGITIMATRLKSSFFTIAHKDSAKPHPLRIPASEKAFDNHQDGCHIQTIPSRVVTIRKRRRT